ncbi:GUN4 N-terminal ARM-like repeat domain-containing protein [Phormidium sp. CCY1219]|uniref:GUN4 N-terminal ARM-like repeat domain-containing protein n=1 Tax=Phormidium sp. CCY1219 TaxID=2886104 RepID=UPI002D1EA555|nr:GUN4 N-terminal ARM-like repeat domain-containing protein [Phormidium sp. CCY1219]MEB3830196.1 GUN4 domain-containing protein [Phormidium sp. CCY1219]
MNEPTNSAVSDASIDLAAIRSKLKTAPEKTQLKLMQQLSEIGEAGLNVIKESLQEQRDKPPSAVQGKAYQLLLNSNSSAIAEFLATEFPTGLVPERSENNIDYSELQKLLAKQEFQSADKLTLQKLCENAGPDAVQRKWLYFTEVDKIPVTDLQTIDTLWRVYSEGKFGFSVQREIWLGVGKNWEKMWPKINWKEGNIWTRYPGGFTWDLSAPRGHLPLSNQLRGVRVIEKLLTHPAWE